MNAVVAFDIERATAEARAADEARVAGRVLGPLGGIPLTVKDTFETAGCVTTAGAPALADHLPESDADVVAGLRDAGAVIFGKTNVPLYAGDHQTYNDVYGLTRNPWDPERTAGGSSGGSAVSVACGFSLGEYGSDIGSSIRAPAHFNGVFGLKPSWGVVSQRGHVPWPPGSLGTMDLSVMGPIARTIEDLELLFDASLRHGAMRPGRPGPGAWRSPTPERRGRGGRAPRRVVARRPRRPGRHGRRGPPSSRSPRNSRASAPSSTTRPVQRCHRSIYTTPTTAC